MATNRNFDLAYAYVQQHYASLLTPVDSICLIPAVADPSALGRCHRLILRIEGAGRARRAVWSGRSRITITNRRRTISQFVSTIVHELTHAAQFANGERESEYPAYCAGDLAARQYQERCS